jgi:hypothetical protein
MTYHDADEPDLVGDTAQADDEEEAPPPIPPWRAGSTATAPVIEVGPVEKWDDELPVPTRQQEVAAAARRATDQIGPASMRIANLLLFAAAVVGALAGFGVAWLHVVGDPLADAHAYYEAATRLNHGQPLYPPGIDPNGNHIYLYPPLLAIALRPLALLPFEAFAALWELAVVASFIALVRYLGVRQRRTWIAIGLLGVPIGWALTIAQAHVPMTLLLALGQPWSIAIAANLKLTPVLIAIWWLGRRDFQSFFAFAIYTGLLILAQLLLAGSDTLNFFRAVSWEQIGEVRNWSPYAQSPVLWIALVLVGALVTLGLARTRFGWAAAVTFATLAPPRLLVYMFTGLLAALRQPKLAGEPDPDDPVDAATAYRRASR